MMPYVARQRELPSVHGHPSAGQTQLMYHSLPPTPNQTQQQQALDPRYQLQQMPSLFRTQSTSAVPTQSHSNEHLLRRKTPQGTLPAAYDAAPVEWAMRPTKHMILPYNAPNPQPQEPQFHDTSGQTLKPLYWGKEMPPPTGTLRLQGVECHAGSQTTFSPGWLARNGGYGVPGPLEDNLDPYVREFLQQNNQHQMAPPQLIATDQTWMSTQMLGFQGMYNPITPPTASCDDVNGYLLGDNYGGGEWPGRYSTWDSGQMTPSSQLGDAVNGLHIDSPYHHDAWSQQSRIGNTRPSLHQQSRSISSSNFNFSHAPILPDPSKLPLQVMPRGHQILNTQPTFLSRESVAVWAHKACVDLLSSIQAQQRSETGSSNSGSANVKPHLFPRPPNVNSARAALRHQQGSYVISGRSIRSPANDVDGLDRRKNSRSSVGPLQGNAFNGEYQPLVGPSPAHRVSIADSGYPFPILDGSGMIDGNGGLPGAQVQSPLQIPADNYITSAIPRHLVNGIPPLLAQISPVSTAPLPELSPAAKQYEALSQAAGVLPILENMCAESGWTWIDGMLLGGCLAYVGLVILQQLARC